MATVADIGTIELIPGTQILKVEVILFADNRWMYACRAASLDYVRALKRGDRVRIHPNDKYVHLKTSKGKNLQLQIIAASPWANL